MAKLVVGRRGKVRRYALFVETVKKIGEDPGYSYDLTSEYRRHSIEKIMHNICKRIADL